MKKFSLMFLLAALICAFMAPAASARTISEEKARIDEICDMALDRYNSKDSKYMREIDRAYGYAVICASRTLFFERGRGIAVNNQTGEKLYLKLNGITILGFGLGIGGDEFDLLFLMPNKESWDYFLSGKLRMEATADALASFDGNSGVGGYYNITSRNVKVYPLYKRGLEAEVLWTPVKIYAPKKLN